jgi:hypothetical protein
MLLYTELEIGLQVKVQTFYGRLTDNFYTGIITNMDGQNIVVETQTHTTNEPIVDGCEIRERAFEACNPDYAVVTLI